MIELARGGCCSLVVEAVPEAFLRISYNAAQFRSTCLSTACIIFCDKFPTTIHVLSELPLVSECLLSRYLAPLQSFCGTYPMHCVHEMIEERSRLTPELTAAVFNDEQITFGHLNAQANQLAQHLAGLGSRPEVLVAIHDARSIDLLVAVLAVLKTGAALVLLDASLPAGRVQNVLQDAGAPIVIAASHLANRFQGLDVSLVCLASDRTQWENNSKDNFP